MGWNMIVTVVQDRSPGDLAAIGLRADGAPVTGEEAASAESEVTTLAGFGSNTVLLGTTMDRPYEEPALADRLGTRVVTLMFSSVTETYALMAWGPTGDRTLASVEYEIVTDEGEPLPEEADVEQLDEDSMFDLLAAIGGLPDEWLDAQFRPLG